MYQNNEELRNNIMEHIIYATYETEKEYVRQILYNAPIEVLLSCAREVDLAISNNKYVQPIKIYNYVMNYILTTI